MAVPSAYCEPADLYDHGLPRGALPNPGRLIASVAIGAETLTLDGHGFRLNQRVMFRAEGGGSLPAPIVADSTYYAIPVSEWTFQVAAAENGSPVNLTTAGSRIIVITPLPVEESIEWASSMIDDFLPAHLVPLDSPYPTSVIAATAQLAIAKLLSYTGQAPGTLSDTIMSAQKIIDRWSKGVPIRGAIVPPSANLAMKSGSNGDPRGWSGTDGSLP